MNKRYWNMASILFNIGETVLLILFGLLLKISYVDMLITFFTFEIGRAFFKLPKHYKAWQKCLIWTIVIFISLFVVSRVDITVGMMCSVFTSYILSGKADIKDMYMWSGKTSKYEALKDLVAISPNNAIILEHEEYWRKNYPVRYEIFKYYFRENKSYQEIAEIKGFDDNSITKRECATIYSVLERPLNLPPINK